MAEGDAAAPTPDPAAVVPELPAPVPTARRSPRGARFAGPPPGRWSGLSRSGSPWTRRRGGGGPWRPCSGWWGCGVRAVAARRTRCSSRPRTGPPRASRCSRPSCSAPGSARTGPRCCGRPPRCPPTGWSARRTRWSRRAVRRTASRSCGRAWPVPPPRSARPSSRWPRRAPPGDPCPARRVRQGPHPRRSRPQCRRRPAAAGSAAAGGRAGRVGRVSLGPGACLASGGLQRVSAPLDAPARRSRPSTQLRAPFGAPDPATRRSGSPTGG